MPVTLEVVDAIATEQSLGEVFAYFESVDARFSTYKETSEISAFNRGEIALEQASLEMQTIMALAEDTRRETNGYFDIRHNGKVDPSGLVKGWAIRNAAEMFRHMNFHHFYVEAGGDVQAVGRNYRGARWRVGIRNPFDQDGIIKVLAISDCGVATSGTYVRGHHIYNPKNPTAAISEIVSLTVIGPDIYDADRYATAAFAMGKEGITFVEQLNGFEGYMVNREQLATFTSGFERYVANAQIH